MHDHSPAGLRAPGRVGGAGLRRIGPGARRGGGGAGAPGTDELPAGHHPPGRGRSGSGRRATGRQAILPHNRQARWRHQPHGLDRLQPRAAPQPGLRRGHRQCVTGAIPGGTPRGRPGAQPGTDRHPLRRSQPRQAQAGQHLPGAPGLEPLRARRAGQPQQHLGDTGRWARWHLRQPRRRFQHHLGRGQQQGAGLHQRPGKQRLRLHPGQAQPGGPERAERELPGRR
ncbi:hypothetical protein D9M70_462080 [compost metagenome]